MTRRRYTEAQLTPVRRLMSTTYRRPGDPAAGTRQECWEALSVDAAGVPDGLWSFARDEEPGSFWMIKHLPTGYVPVGVQWRTLDDARHDAHTGRVWAGTWVDALWHLGVLRERPDAAVPINDHDRARAYLTWAAENGHGLDPSGRPIPLESVATTG